MPELGGPFESACEFRARNGNGQIECGITKIGNTTLGHSFGIIAFRMGCYWELLIISKMIPKVTHIFGNDLCHIEQIVGKEFPLNSPMK